MLEVVKKSILLFSRMLAIGVVLSLLGWTGAAVQAFEWDGPDDPPSLQQLEREGDQRFWGTLDCRSAYDMRAYLDAYPQGQYVEEATRCLTRTDPPPSQSTPPDC